jgi:putative endonuclease
MKSGYVYIMANKRNGTIYIGVTSDLVERVWQHREAVVPGFTKRYGCKMLVWFEAFDDLQDTRRRELQMKEWKRRWKLEAIEAMNPTWRDLYNDLI